MRRLIALLLILLLPFQTTLAAEMAIAMGGMNDLGATVQMEEQPCHHADMASADEASTPSHDACGICHFGCCSAIPMTLEQTATLAVFDQPPSASSFALLAPPNTRPERPKWRDLA